MSKNSQTNVGNVLKISIFQAISSVNFTISLSKLGIYIEKIKVDKDSLNRWSPKENLKASNESRQ